MIDRFTLRGVTVSALLMLAAATGAAQSGPRFSDVPHPRIGVVLSGGSAKGFAHIGVLQVLEEMGIPVDVVTGTSMGAIIGGLYASGYTPGELEHLAITEDWDNFFRRPTNRRQQSFAEKLDGERFTISFPLVRARPGLPAAVIPRQGIAEHLERYVWPTFDVTDLTQLPSAFGALVTDLSTGDPILLHDGPLAQAIEASAAVPGAFPPLILADGRTVIDGAVVRNIPAEDARALGADILICVDVSERIKSLDSLSTLIQIVDQTVAFRVQWADVAQRALCRVVISPELDGLPSRGFAKPVPWIDRGRDAALAHRSELQAIADSVHKVRGPTAVRRKLPRADSVFVRTVTWSKVSEGAHGIVQGMIKLRDSSWVTQPQVEAAAARVYSTGRFDQVSYRIVPGNGGHDLVFDLTEGDRDVLGVGIRYDTPRGVSLLVSASVADWISPASTASITGRLGEEQQFDARDVLGEGPNSHFLQTYSVTITRTPLPRLRAADDFTAPILAVSQASAEIGRALSTTIQVGVKLSHQWSRDGASGPDTALASRYESYTTASATVRIDTYDRTFAPTNGFAAFWQSEVASRDHGSNATFSRQLLDAHGALPIISGISLLAGADLGFASGADLPLHDHFFLGGSVPSEVWPGQFIPFLGVDPQSVAGRAVQVVQAGVQAEPSKGWIVALRGNVGNVFSSWPVGYSRSTYRSGIGLTLGTQLQPGPLSFTLATRGLRDRPVFEIVFGATF